MGEEIYLSAFPAFYFANLLHDVLAVGQLAPSSTIQWIDLRVSIIGEYYDLAIWIFPDPIEDHDFRSKKFRRREDAIRFEVDPARLNFLLT